jgi:uncharacterized membrane protein YgcG
MRPTSAAWERAAEVHEVAQSWLRVGAIDEPTGDTIRKAFPDPCVTPSAVWRVLTACVVAAVILCALEAFSLTFRPVKTGYQVLLFLFAAVSLVTADLLEASPRFARRGAAGAAGFLGLGFLLVGFGLFFLDAMRMRFDNALDAVLVVSVLAWAAGCWRWGSPLFAALSALSLFLLLGRLPYGRVLWVLVGAALAGLAVRRLDEASWAPSHRRAAAVLVVAGIVAAYAAVNVYSLDKHLLEDLGRFAARWIGSSQGLLVLAALATAAVPLAVLAWGARSRRTFLLDTGIVLLALSLATLRHYVHIAPLWAMLLLSGAALVILALTVERALRRAPAGDIAGFTGDPLFSDERRQHALQVVPVVAAFTSAAPGPAAQESDFTGGGGKFGGGGASEKF